PPPPATSSLSLHDALPIFLGLLVIVATAAIGVASIPAARIFSDNATDAILIAPLLLAYLVSLLPLAVLFIVQRTFYAYGDARTPDRKSTRLNSSHVKISYA